MLQRIYETIIILNPVLSDEQTKSIAKKYIDYIKSKEGLIRNEEYWGLKKLSYPIYKKQTGWYCLFEYSILPNHIIDIEGLLKKDERIIRFLTVKLDKYGVEYSQLRVKKRLNNIDSLDKLRKK
jgi:small subunit ribosomal protein S6